jgi:hypothetical protein
VDPSRSSTVDELTDAGSIGSLNVTATFVLTATSVAPRAGVVEATLGGSVSPGWDVSKTTSTQ